MLYETVYFANTSCMIFITSVFSFNHELQAKNATMLSYDIIPCNDGHLEERKKKKKTNYIIFPTHNSVLATCH